MNMTELTVKQLAQALTGRKYLPGKLRKPTCGPLRKRMRQWGPI